MPETMSPPEPPQNRSATRREPGDDRPVRPQDDDLTVIKAIMEFRDEADRARRTRMMKNKANFDAYHGTQDWRHKSKGQSKEFLPKVPMAVEQFSAFVKRALVAFGDWFQVETPPGPLSPEEIRRLLMVALEDVGLGPDGDPVDFATRISDGVKMATLGSVMILKVHGRRATERRYVVEQGLQAVALPDGQMAPQVTESLDARNVTQWKLLVDLVRQEDYYPDPTGHGLYEIHEIERDLSHVIEWAEAGIYDKAAVEAIEGDFARLEQESKRARETGQDVSYFPSFRKRVVIHEFWGTLLDSSGKVVMRNCMAAVANERYLIRKPAPNPYWHGQTPFVVLPIIRVPGSAWHKALADHMTPLNLALNELYNLMLDGSIASVWGMKQIRTGWMEDPAQVSDGIPQGITIKVNSQAPEGGKVLETVSEGQVPQDAMAMFAQTDREFQNAAMTNDLALGNLPSKQVKATEIMEASAGRNTTMDGIVSDLDRGMSRVLDKVWNVLMQFAEDLDADQIVGAVGTRAALSLARMSPAQRFATYNGCKFRVFGLTAVLSKFRDFQKLAALFQMVSANPLFLQSFATRYSVDKALDHTMKTLNIDPQNLTMSIEEQANLQQRLAELPFFMQLAGVKQEGGDGMPGGPGAIGDAGMPAEINQMAAPITGGAPNL